MKFAKTKFWKAIADDPVRPRLNDIHYNAEEQRLEASDGYIAAFSLVELDEGEEPGDLVLNPDVFKGAGGGPIRIDGEDVRVGNKTTHHLIVNYRDELDTPYPDVERLIPESKGEYLFSLDARKLLKLAEAICEKRPDDDDVLVALFRPNGPENAIVVLPVGLPWRTGPKTFGLIMPVYAHEPESMVIPRKKT